MPIAKTTLIINELILKKGLLMQMRKTAMLSKILLFCLMVCLCSASLFARADKTKTHPRSNEGRAVFKAFRAERYKKADLFIPGHGRGRGVALDLPEEFIVEVPFRGEMKLLWLQKHSVRSADFRMRSYKDGVYTDVTPPPVRTYRGEVVDEPGFRVAASLSEDGLSATVIGGKRGSWHIKPLRKANPAALRASHVVYDAEDKIPEPGVCGMMPEMHDHADHEQSAAEIATVTSQETESPLAQEAAASEAISYALDTNCTARRAVVSYDMDNAEYNKHGSLAAAQAALESKHNWVATVYVRDSLVVLEILETIFRQTEFYDYEINNQSTSLGEFKTKWQDQTASINHRQ
jgi:hypothetical protein